MPPRAISSGIARDSARWIGRPSPCPRCVDEPGRVLRAEGRGKRLQFLPQLPFSATERRRAITALYAFCREVDDVVDEVADPGARAPETRLVAQRESRAGLLRAPAASRRSGAATRSGDLRLAAGASPGGDRRHEHGPRAAAVISTSSPSSVTAITSRASSVCSPRRSSATLIRRRAATRTISASLSSSPTSSATWARTRAAAASIFRRMNWRGSSRLRPICSGSAPAPGSPP